MGGALTYLITGKHSTIADQMQYQIVTLNGTRSELLLADGTKVWLNAGSTLRYSQDYNMTSREVELTGEAFFEVKTNKSKPFVVNSSELKIKALGTSFNVKAYPDENTLTATLVEGKLTIEGKSEKTGDFKYTLTPKQKLVIYKNEVPEPAKSDSTELAKNVIEKNTEETGNKIESVKVASNVNTELYTSWKDNRWIIERESISDMAVMLERRYNVKIIYKPDELDNFSFSGTIENETFEQVLNILQLSAPLQFEFGKGEVTVSIDINQQERFQKFMGNKRL